jgi:hypothetical protein
MMPPRGGSLDQDSSEALTDEILKRIGAVAAVVFVVNVITVFSSQPQPCDQLCAERIINAALGLCFEIASVGLVVAVLIDRLRTYRKRLAEGVIVTISTMMVFGFYIVPSLESCVCSDDGEAKSWAIVSTLIFTTLAILVRFGERNIAESIRSLANRF